ncbi:hypothetical protein CEUSTIGMA_g11029.t1 [Chlamydomonas eustigma]|uniref:Uncharacterized protein ycf33 n=1 Tax=Chlamydomonas eustigma TaxID=1157962 RepID=A0A250XKK5_9CHLO|nr:hypothetical protein CEUSTIGMA_g11029.t1 [Chlamydomonas eustigma]|eukprot:GAX83604.1 hypothetical protein CEUSTIGMA_g11029.t1 [Chlamydomonas eustigma]
MLCSTRYVKSYGRNECPSKPALTCRISRKVNGFTRCKDKEAVIDVQDGPSVSKDSSSMEVEAFEIQQSHDRSSFFIYKTFILETCQPSAGTSLALSVLTLGLLSFATLASPAQASEPHILTSLFELSESQEFWGNVLRYGRYFVTVMLGTGYVMLRPIAGMFKKSPLNALLAVGLIVGAVLGTKITLDAMLGLSEQVGYASNGFM